MYHTYIARVLPFLSLPRLLEKKVLSQYHHLCLLRFAHALNEYGWWVRTDLKDVVYLKLQVRRKHMIVSVPGVTCGTPLFCGHPT